MTTWVLSVMAVWCTAAPAIAVVTGRTLARRTAGSVDRDDLLRVPSEWTAGRLDVAGS